MKNNVSAIAFDIDGTLYPSWRFYIKVFPFFIKHFKLMKAFNKTRKEIRVWQANNPDKINEDFFTFQAKIFSGFINEDAEYLKKFVEEEVYKGWQEIFHAIKPYSNAKNVIEELKKQGLKIAVLSDFVPEQKQDIWGILPLCDLALASERMGVLKPSKFVFENLAESLDTKAEEILYVGNNFRYDVLGAKQIGMKTAYISNPISLAIHKFFKRNKNKKADIYFSNYNEFLSKFNEFTDCSEKK